MVYRNLIKLINKSIRTCFLFFMFESCFIGFFSFNWKVKKVTRNSLINWSIERPSVSVLRGKHTRTYTHIDTFTVKVKSLDLIATLPVSDSPLFSYIYICVCVTLWVKVFSTFCHSWEGVAVRENRTIL